MAKKAAALPLEAARLALKPPTLHQNGAREAVEAACMALGGATMRVEGASTCRSEGQRCRFDGQPWRKSGTLAPSRGTRGRPRVDVAPEWGMHGRRRVVVSAATPTIRRDRIGGVSEAPGMVGAMPTVRATLRSGGVRCAHRHPPRARRGDRATDAAA